MTDAPHTHGVRPDRAPAVLLVDDRPENLLALEAALEGLGLDLVRATSGAEALRHVLEREFALILLDVQMPGMDGFEVARHIQSRERTRHVPILFLTAIDSTPERVMQGYAAGAVDFLTKPFHADILRSKVAVFAELDRRARLLRDSKAREQAFQELAEERLQSQRVLRDSEERFRVLAETAADAIVTVDEDSVIAYANPAVERIFGYSPDALVGASLERLMPAASWAGHRAGVARYLATGKRHVSWQGLALPGLRADGSEVALEINFAEFEGAGRRFFTATMRDVTERRRAESERERLLEEAQTARAEAEAARAEAETANRTKSEFMANMSHELRTPLNAVIGYADLMELGVHGPVTSSQREDLARIKTSGRHLLGLIDDILDLAKMEAGKLVVAREPGDAALAIDDALPLVIPQAAAKGIKLEDHTLRPGRYPYLGDDARVVQILVNLLDNAVKFTESGGCVLVQADETDTSTPDAILPGPGCWTRIRITDTGIGIAPGMLGAVFRPFEQAESSHTRKFGGTGLGLAISRELARLMGGDLTVTSTLGHGATFTLCLPSPPMVGVV